MVGYFNKQQCKRYWAGWPKKKKKKMLKSTIIFKMWQEFGRDWRLTKTKPILVGFIVTKGTRNGDSIVLCLMASGKEEIYCCRKNDREFQYNKDKRFSFATTLFRTMLEISREFETVWICLCMKTCCERIQKREDAITIRRKEMKSGKLDEGMKGEKRGEDCGGKALSRYI